MSFHEPKHRLRGGKGYKLPSDGRVVPGVTSLVAQMDPDPGGLIWWATGLACEAAVETREAWDPLDLKADAVALIRGRAESRQTLQRNVGSATHDVVSALTFADVREAGDKGYPVSVHPSVRPFVNAWESWKAATNVVLIGSEVTLVNREIGYAGTADAIGEVPGLGRVLIDYKTGKSIRRKDYGQVTLLACAEAILHDSGAEEEWDGVDALWLVQLRPQGWLIHEVPWGTESATNRAARLAVALVHARQAADSLEADVKVHSPEEQLS